MQKRFAGEKGWRKRADFGRLVPKLNEMGSSTPNREYSRGNGKGLNEYAKKKKRGCLCVDANVSVRIKGGEGG